MNNMKKNRLCKTLVGITLSLSLLAPGSLMLNTAPAHAASVSTSTAANIIETGKRYMGVPYQFGAPSGQSNTFDCSSFTQYVFKQNGIDLPRSSRQQAQVGTYVSRDQLQPGDLVFFYSPIHHVAIYMGNGKLLHTFGKQGVTITDLNSGTWNSSYATARRVIPGGGGSAAPSNSQPQAQPALTTPGNATTTDFTPGKDTASVGNHKASVSKKRHHKSSFSKSSHKTSHSKSHRSSESSGGNHEE